MSREAAAMITFNGLLVLFLGLLIAVPAAAAAAWRRIGPRRD